MSKLVKCKSCGQEIAKTAKTCPHCGAKNKSGSIAGAIMIVFVLLLIIIAVSGGNDDVPEKVSGGENDPSAVSGSSDEIVFKVGDTAKLNDIYVTFVAVEEYDGDEFTKPADGNVFVSCEFTIENRSDEDLTISSLMCFDAYFDDFATDISFSASSATDAKTLDGTVAAGKKINGVVSYEVPSDWKELEVHFEPDAWSSDEFVFVHEK